MKHVSAPAATAARASLHIEELVIRGLPGLNPRAIGDAVQTRLALLLSQIDGAVGDLGEKMRLTAPTIRIGADARAEEIGNKIARAVCDALLAQGATDEEPTCKPAASMRRQRR